MEHRIALTRREILAGFVALGLAGSARAQNIRKVRPGKVTGASYIFKVDAEEYIKLRYRAPGPPDHTVSVLVKLSVNGKIAGYLTQEGLTQSVEGRFLPPSSSTAWVDLTKWTIPGVNDIKAECFYRKGDELAAVSVWFPNFDVEAF